MICLIEVILSGCIRICKEKVLIFLNHVASAKNDTLETAVSSRGTIIYESRVLGDFKNNILLNLFNFPAALLMSYVYILLGCSLNTFYSYIFYYCQNVCMLLDTVRHLNGCTCYLKNLVRK